jgi:amino acid adenylation domain-containing protein
MVDHGNLVNLVTNFIAELAIDHSHRIVGATGVGFDIFGLELFAALCTGASLLLLDQELEDVASLIAVLDRYQPTLLQGTPSFWSLLSMAGWQPQQSDRPRDLVALCGGEAMSQSLAGYLLKIAARVYQVYGPTETTIWSSRQLLHDDSQYAVIGHPIGDTRIYVLDETQALLPQCAHGELYIGGKGVTRGYYRQPALSAERFLSLQPYGSDSESEKLYRTGDRGYWNERGELVYVGRFDFQIKIRGHRVELGEIEHWLNQQVGISQTVVQANGIADLISLDAYVVMEHGVVPNCDAWRAALRERLPSYMIPRSFIVLDSLPKTLNGKIDRQALPDPNPHPSSPSVAPEGMIEQQLALIWQQVLQLDQVGVTDHFFSLGGHSLLAAQMLIAAAKMLTVQLSLSDIMRYPTIRELAAYISSGGSRSTGPISVPLSANTHRFPLSLEQRHLYFIDQYHEATGNSLNLSVIQRLSGPLNVDCLGGALQTLLTRHELLNVHMAEDAGQLEQHYSPLALPPLVPVQVSREKLGALLRREVTTNFDLRQAPLYRIKLLQLADQEFILIFVLPHIIADGWSLDLLNRELSIIYGALKQGLLPQLSPLNQRYSDMVVWQTNWFASKDFNHSVDFWRHRLEGYGGLHLPSDFPPVRERSFSGAHREFTLSKELTLRLKSYAAGLKVSLFSCLYCLFALQLRRYFDQKDLVICVPAANRRLGNEGVVGLFTSMLPLRLTIDDDTDFATMVQAFSHDSQEALAHQGVPLESIQIRQNGYDGPHDFLQVVFAFQNANHSYTLDLDGIVSEFVSVEDGVTKYDLFLSMREADGLLLANIEYASEFFHAERIGRMGDHFIALAEQILLDATTVVGDLNIVCGTELAQLMPSAKAAPTDDDDLISWFGRAARSVPLAVALQDGAQIMSYIELDTASNRLARRLRMQYRQTLGGELKADTLIGLCVEPGIPMLVAILAILKAGGAYVPLDPHYPAQRLQYMLVDSGICLLISSSACLQHSSFIEALPAGRCVLLDKDEEVDTSTERLPVLCPDQLAYVIYTSGSTGNPKGTMVSHRNVVRLFQTSTHLFSFSQQDVWCLFHSYAFDFSVWEIWGALLYGARLNIVPYYISRDPEQFRAFLVQQEVTILNQTPTAFSQLLNEEVRHNDCLSLRYVIFGGESLQLATLKPWYRKYANATRLINMYGITEATVHVTFRELTSADVDMHYCNNIGKPLPDFKALVLDSRRRLCPIGVGGELYLGGPGLTRGYLKQPLLTRRSFIVDDRLFDGERLYKTGDLAKWLPDGHLEYLGRNDHQVKVRGFRIELGELQSTLMTFPQVSNALALQDSERGAILLYYVSEQVLDTDVLYQHLKQTLPDFMLPQRLIHLQALPLTSNGKIDRIALGTLTPVTSSAMPPLLTPLNAQECLLAKIWQRVLSRPIHNIHANFFTVGGDSLRVLEVMRQLRQAGYSFTPRELFNNPTISQLAKILRPIEPAPLRHLVMPFSLISSKQRAIYQMPEDEDIYPLTALQEGMLFHSELTAEVSTYLDIISCRVTGVFRLVDFQNVLKDLMRIHHVLRTVFVRNKDGSWQKLRHIVKTPLTVYDLTRLASDAQEQSLVQFFSSERGLHFMPGDLPLWRLSVHLLNGGFHLTLTCHHAILDGWSVAVFLTQLLKQYDHTFDNTASVLVARSLAFRDYVGEEIVLRQDQEVRRYWQETWQHFEPTLIAPGRGSNHSGSLARHSVQLSGELREALNEMVLEDGVALDSILLAAHIFAISRYTGRRRVATGWATNGRLDDDENNEMLGLFLNSTPFCISIDRDQSPWEFLQRLILHKANLQPFRSFPLRDIQQNAGRGVLFDTLFNFVNFHIFEQLRGLRHLQVHEGYCYEETNFALVCQTGINPSNGNLEVEMIYQKKFLDREKIVTLDLFFQEALHDLSSRKAGEAERQNSAAVAALLPPREWAGGIGKDLGQTGIAERVSAIALLHPDRVAIREGSTSLSYSMLEDWATALACQMRDQCGEELTGKRIGLFSSRRISTIVSMLAILKAGAAYVPLDENYPRIRLEQLIQDADLTCIVGCPKTLAMHEWIPAMQAFFLPLHPTLGVASANLAPLIPKGDGVAYVMYTSGSSGTPKGVMIEQAAIIRLVVDTDYICIQPQHVVAQAASLSFDAATLEVWGALLNGATLVLAPSASLLDSRIFENFLHQEQVDILWLTARLFDRHVNSGHAAMFRNLSYLLVGGDALNLTTIAQVLHCPEGRPRHLLNGYGPTENTTFTCVHEVNEISLQGESIPIGRPISRTQVFVLDELCRQVPIGHAGELCTSGTGLARGYLNSGDNDAAFVELELADADSVKRRRRLYRTGDAVRWLPSGELTFLGRMDRTLKVNGYRVDLNEIETAALACPNVTQCAATVCGNERRQLILYFSSGQAQCTAEELRIALKCRLPSFMVPTHIISLAALPLNQNGKIDITQLPPLSNFNTDNPQPVFISNTQRRLHAIWSDLLPIPVISVQNSFFEQGGDSLLAMQLQHQINHHFQSDIAVVDVFRYPTIETMARHLDGASEINGKADPNDLLRAQRLRAQHTHLRSRSNTYEG